MKNVYFKLALGFVSVAAALAAVERYNKRKTVKMESAVEAATAPFKEGNPPTEGQLVDLGIIVEQAVKEAIEKDGKPVKTVVIVVDKTDDEAAEKPAEATE